MAVVIWLVGLVKPRGSRLSVGPGERFAVGSEALLVDPLDVPRGDVAWKVRVAPVGQVHAQAVPRSSSQLDWVVLGGVGHECLFDRVDLLLGQEDVCDIT